MAYDRGAALKYAETYWTKPCHDEVFWRTDGAVSIPYMRKALKAPTSEGWEAVFVRKLDAAGALSEKAVFRRASDPREIEISPWDGLADCANFLSHCLQAGGAKEVKERGVRELVGTLQARKDTKTLAEKVTAAAAQRVIDTGIFKKGDMIGYFTIDASRGDFGRLGYAHSTMFAGRKDSADPGRVTCHTMCRYPGFTLSGGADNLWTVHDWYAYTLIHFTADDAIVPPNAAKDLSGWWKGTFGGEAFFYFILADGRARWTRTAPRAKAELSPHSASGTGYWFGSGRDFIFIWRSTGSVEVWTPDATSGGFTVTWNTTRRGSATKL